MNIAAIWLTKLILAHLLTDFVLQPNSWVQHRQQFHFASGKLYLHGLVTALVAVGIIGLAYWPIALLIFVTHVLIDGWKSYQPTTARFFLIDQSAHLLVILFSWWVCFSNWHQLVQSWQQINARLYWWKLATAVVFLTFPAGILIAQLTSQWRNQIANSEGLANAGKWIGIIERLVILCFVLLHQYSAIGLLVAAKGIIRFSEKDRPEVKTEYLVIGTLLSIGLSLAAGLLVQW